MSTDRDLLSQLDQHLLKNFRPKAEQYFRENSRFELSRFEIAEDEYNSERTKKYLTRKVKGQKKHIQSVKIKFTLKANTQELDMLAQVASNFETMLDEEIKEWSNEMTTNYDSLLIQPVNDIQGRINWKDIKVDRMPVIGKIITVIREFDLIYST